ncbi:MAG: hypothetical protein Q7S08_04395 [bacterium]|nr:hypothetical protein [bacterium]
MTVRYARNLAVVALAIIVIAPTLVFGAVPGPIVNCSGALPGTTVDGKTQAACTVCDIAKTAQNVLNTAIYIAVFLSAILFAYAGIIYVTNIANHGEITKAKNIFSNVLIGLVIILASWLVIDTLMKILVNEKAIIGPWHQVC